MGKTMTSNNGKIFQGARNHCDLTHSSVMVSTKIAIKGAHHHLFYYQAIDRAIAS